MLGAKGEKHDGDRNTDESAERAPEKRPEKHREQDDGGRQSERSAADARLDIAADDELDGIQAKEHPQRGLPGRELRQRVQSGQRGGDERSDIGNIVEPEGDGTPLGRERQAGDGSDGPDQKAGDGAHESPDHHVLAQLRGGDGAAVEQDAGGLAVGHRPHLAGEVAHLQQTEHHVEQHDQPERQRGADASGDLLDRAHQPAHVEVLGPRADERDTMRIEPCLRLLIEKLKPCRVAHERLTDAAEAPQDERCERQKRRHDGEHHDCQREELRHARLQMRLQRPCQGNDEEPQCERREDRARHIGRGEDRDHRDQSQRRGGHAVSPHADTPGGTKREDREPRFPRSRFCLKSALVARGMRVPPDAEAAGISAAWLLPRLAPGSDPGPGRGPTRTIHQTRWEFRDERPHCPRF